MTLSKVCKTNKTKKQFTKTQVITKNNGAIDKKNYGIIS